MALLGNAAAVAALVSVCACEFTREPTPLELTGARPTVHALVVAGSESVQLQLYSVDPGRDPQGYGNSLLAPISGAHVVIASGTDQTVLTERAVVDSTCFGPEQRAGINHNPVAGCYGGLLPHAVVTGRDYNLSINLPGGGSVSGTARAPAPPQVILPQPGRVASHPYGQSHFIDIPVQWAPDPDAPLHQAAFLNVIPFRNGAVVEGGRCAAGVGELNPGAAPNTASLHAFGIDCFEKVAGHDQLMAWDSLHLSLRVVAYDTAYSRYLRGFNSEKIRADAATVGITGALGVFGGAAFTDVPLTILPPS